MGRNYLGENPDKDSIVYKRVGNTPPLPLLKDEKIIQQQPDQSSLTERYVEESIKFIRENKDKPFFLYFAHMHVHLPHYPPQRFLDQAENGPYGAAVECIDWATDAIMQELKDRGIDDNTIIIFTSDNGSNLKFGGSNGRLKGKKGDSWDGGSRVPCIIRWPGSIPKDMVCDELVTALDLLPTLANLADGKTPSDRIIDGVDVSNLLFDPNAESPRESFFYYQCGGLAAVRDRQWKYFVDSSLYSEGLYDLKEDISESNDLLEKNPDTVDRLKKLIDKCRIDLGDKYLDMDGKNTRPVGRVDNPKTLTTYDPDHPYIVAMYDVSDGKSG